MKKKFTIVLCVVLMLTFVFMNGCTAPQPAPAATAPAAPAQEAKPAEEAKPNEEPAKDGPIRIAVIVKSLANPFWMMASKGAEDMAAQLGADNVQIQIFSSLTESDYNTQAGQMEDAITSGYDAICIVPGDGKALVPSVETAVAAGIPVVVMDTSIPSDKISSFVASDNIASAAMAADYIGEKLGGKGSIAVIRGAQGATVEMERYQGFSERLAAAYPDIKIVNEGHANWEAAAASALMEDMMNANPEIQAVFCESDAMAGGAAQMAIADQRQDIIIVGHDGNVEELRMIKEGKLAADIAQSPYLIGSMSVEAAYKIVKGEKVEARVVTPVTLVTIDNAEALVKEWEALGF